MKTYLKIGFISCIGGVIGLMIKIIYYPPSSKIICKRLLSGEITEQKASDVLISKGGWRGGGEGALFYQCGYFLKGEESYIR